MDRNRRRICPTGAFLLGLVVVVSLGSAWGQTLAWTRQFGSAAQPVGLADYAVAVAVDASGSIYVAGTTYGTFPGQSSGGGGTSDAFLRKYDANGAELWTRQFGTPVFDEANAVAVDSNGSIYVAGVTDGTLAGQSSSPGWGEAFVRKYDANGAELWTRQFGTAFGARGYAAAVDATGSVYVAGYTNGTLPGQSSTGFTDAFVRKYSASGTELWTRQFGTRDADLADAVAVDAAGSIYVAGLTDGALPGQSNAGITGITTDAFVRKYDANGTELWTRQFGTPVFDEANAVAVDSNGSIYVAGFAGDALPGQSSAGLDDAFVRKYNAGGTELWTRQFGAPAGEFLRTDRATGVAVDAGGVVHVVGSTAGTLPAQTSAGGDDAFVRQYDADGTEVWTRQFGSSGGDGALAMATDASGSIYVAGSLQQRFEIDAFLTKFALPCRSVPGDVNGDCRVDCQDLTAVRPVLGRHAGGPGWYARADVVPDNVINVRDLAFVAQKLPAGTHCP